MPRVLTVQLMCDGLGTADENAVLSARTLRLDDLGIDIVDNLELITVVEDLYLQRNSISSLPDMSCLSRLRFLALQYNQIEDLSQAHLERLTRLAYLDISNNKLQSLTDNVLPKSLIILKCSNNPVMASLDIPALMSALPSLQQVNGTATAREHGEARKEATGGKGAAGSSQDRDFANELRDLQAGLGARYSGLRSSAAKVDDHGMDSTEAAQHSSKRQAIIDKYKEALQDSTATLQDMERAVVQERAAGLQNLAAGLRSTREAVVQRSHARTEAEALAQQEAVKAMQSRAQGDTLAEEAEPVWKKVLAKLEADEKGLHE